MTAKVHKYYRSPHVPYICTAKRHFGGSPFVGANGPLSLALFPLCAKENSFHCLHFRVRLQAGMGSPPAVRNTWSGPHRAQSPCDLGVPAAQASLVVPLSADTLVLFQNETLSWELSVHHIYECVAWPTTPETIPQQLMRSASFLL